MTELESAVQGERFEIDTRAADGPQRGAVRNFLGLHRFKLPFLRVASLPTAFSRAELATLGITTAVNNAVMLLGQYLKNEFKPMAPVVLTAYFYSYLSNLKQILSLKAQGKTLSVRLQNEPGRQITVEANPYYVLLTNLLEEGIVNSALSLAIDQELPIAKLAAASLAFAIAKIPVEQRAATLEMERNAAKERGETGKAAYLEVKRLVLQNFLFNGVFPILKTVVMLAPKGTAEVVCTGAACAILGAIGSAAAVQEVRRQNALRRAIDEKSTPDTCGRILISIARNSSSDLRLAAISD